MHLLRPGGQCEEHRLVNLDLEVAPLEIDLDVDRFKMLLVVGEAVRIPELRGFLFGFEVLGKRIRLRRSTPIS